MKKNNRLYVGHTHCGITEQFRAERLTAEHKAQFQGGVFGPFRTKAGAGYLQNNFWEKADLPVAVLEKLAHS